MSMPIKLVTELIAATDSVAKDLAFTYLCKGYLVRLTETLHDWHVEIFTIVG